MDPYDDDFDFKLPDFFRPKPLSICATIGCERTALANKRRCLDCEVAANIDLLYTEMDRITRKG